MFRKHTLVGLILGAAPLLVLAQTTNTPGGQASTGTPLEQTKTSSQKPASDNAMSPTSTSSDGTAMKKKSRRKAKNTQQTGDMPTYPAPAPDGTPTK
jgi:hypothetical protein